MSQMSMKLLRELFQAVCDEDIVQVDIMLQQYPSMVNIGENFDGDTLLSVSTRMGNLPMTKILISHGADPNYINGIGASISEYAFFGKNMDVVNYLLDTCGMSIDYLVHTSAITQLSQYIGKRQREIHGKGACENKTVNHQRSVRATINKLSWSHIPTYTRL